MRKEHARNNSDISDKPKSSPKQISPQTYPSKFEKFLTTFRSFDDQDTEFYERKVVDPTTELKGVAIGIPAGIALVTTGTALVNATPAALALVPKALQFTAKQAPKFLKSLVGKAKEAPVVGPKLTKQRITKYLKKVYEVPREQLVKDLESIGLKKAEGSKTDGSLDGRFLKFKHKAEDFQVEIHEPHVKRPNGAKYSHLHIKNKQGQTLSKDLVPVEVDSPEAHIKIKEFSDLNLKGKPQ